MLKKSWHSIKVSEALIHLNTQKSGLSDQIVQDDNSSIGAIKYPPLIAASICAKIYIGKFNYQCRLYMFKLRDVVIFFAGAEFFHTISHIILPYFIALPLDMKFFTFTTTINIWAIIINAVITFALLWWAYRLK